MSSGTRRPPAFTARSAWRRAALLEGHLADGHEVVPPGRDREAQEAHRRRGVHLAAEQGSRSNFAGRRQGGRMPQHPWRCFAAGLQAASPSTGEPRVGRAGYGWRYRVGFRLQAAIAVRHVHLMHGLGTGSVVTGSGCACVARGPAAWKVDTQHFPERAELANYLRISGSGEQTWKSFGASPRLGSSVDVSKMSFRTFVEIVLIRLTVTGCLKQRSTCNNTVARQN